jgi:ribosomal protein L13
MLPKTKLGAAVLRNLKVYAGTEHKQEAQQPVTINLNDLK